MPAKVFLDSNLWIYLHSSEMRKRQAIAELVAREYGNIRLSAQVLNECFNVLTRKILVTALEAKEIIGNMADAYPVSAIHWATVQQAMEIHLAYRYSYYDSLIISSALENRCVILYSEDLQHGHLIEKHLKILNPFEPSGQGQV